MLQTSFFSSLRKVASYLLLNKPQRPLFFLVRNFYNVVMTRRKLNFQGNWSHERIEHPFYTKRRHLEHSAVKALGSIVYSVKTSFFLLRRKDSRDLRLSIRDILWLHPRLSMLGFRFQSSLSACIRHRNIQSRARKNFCTHFQGLIYFKHFWGGGGGVGLSLLERRGLLNLGKMMV